MTQRAWYSRLIGGGELIAVVYGGIPGRKRHGVVEGGKKPSVSKVETGPGQGEGTKGTGAVVDDAIKALPAPRLIDASWGASTYSKGGLMTAIEHVFYQHGPDSGFTNVSKFSQGTSVNDVSGYVDNASRYGKLTPNGPGGNVIECNAGKVIGANVSGAPTSTIKINVRDGVIQTAFPYWLGMVMSSGGTLMERFVVQELDDSVRSVLKDAFDERMQSKSVLLREFEFNCFDVSLNFEKDIVTLQDVLSSGEGNFLDMPIRDFISACGLNVSCSL